MKFYELQGETGMEADTDSGCEDDVQLRCRSEGLVKISEELQQRQRVSDTDKGRMELFYVGKYFGVALCPFFYFATKTFC